MLYTLSGLIVWLCESYLNKAVKNSTEISNTPFIQLLFKSTTTKMSYVSTEHIAKLRN